MKKAVMIAALVVIGTASIFAFGIGVQGGYSLGPGMGGAAVTFKLDNLPWVFAADGYLINNNLALGVTADMWIGKGAISKTPVGYFYGWGVAGNVALGGSYATFGLYARALAGLNFMALNNFLEIYLQAAWQPGIQIGNSGVTALLVHFPIAAGIRFWIK